MHSSQLVPETPSKRSVGENAKKLRPTLFSHCLPPTLLLSNMYPWTINPLQFPASRTELPMPGNLYVRAKVEIVSHKGLLNSASRNSCERAVVMMRELIIALPKLCIIWQKKRVGVWVHVRGYPGTETEHWIGELKHFCIYPPEPNGCSRPFPWKSCCELSAGKSGLLGGARSWPAMGHPMSAPEEGQMELLWRQECRKKSSITTALPILCWMTFRPQSSCLLLGQVLDTCPWTGLLNPICSGIAKWNHQLAPCHPFLKDLEFGLLHS